MRNTIYSFNLDSGINIIMDSHDKWLHLQRFLAEVSMDHQGRLSVSHHSDTPSDDTDNEDEVFRACSKQTTGRPKLTASRSRTTKNKPDHQFCSCGGYNDVKIQRDHVTHGDIKGGARVQSVYRTPFIDMRPVSGVSVVQDKLAEGGEMLTKSDVTGSQDTDEKECCIDKDEMEQYVEIDDLTHLVGPLTENSVVRCLEGRFHNKLYQTWIGPVLVCLNGNQFTPPPLALSVRQTPDQFLEDVVHQAVRNHEDSGHSQVIVVSGDSGSGKTHQAMQMLCHLYRIVGGGWETDSFKQLQAAMTVLRSLGSAATLTNQDSSRMGYLIENYVSDSALYRTKIQCYVVERNRITNVDRNEKNFHIFYQMMAGLSQEEKVKMHLTGYSPHNLNYLCCGNTVQDEAVDKHRFDAWKKSLSVLGIPFSDVIRVMSAILLLGNIQFVQGSGLELDLTTNHEIKAVAALLGVSGVSLYRGFTTKTRNMNGQICKSFADVTAANRTRDSLAKALYCRTVMAVLRRANSMKRLSSTQSTDSLDSSQDTAGFSGLYHQLSHTSTRSHRSQHGSSLSIVDMFGFEVSEVNRLEQLCINLCAETLQHYYNSVIFRRTQDCLRDEGLHSRVEVSYTDNLTILELLSAQRTGIFSILEAGSSSPKSSAENLIINLKSHHRTNSHFFEPLPKDEISFGIRHFAGRVVYDGSLFVQTNRDQLPDDIVAVFTKQSCNFGFVSHLFTQEVKTVGGVSGGAKGNRYRTLPYSSQDPSVIYTDGPGSLCQDFQSRLDKLLKIMMHAQPHFVRCIKTSNQGDDARFDKEVVIRQLRSLQVLETVHLMAGGVPHKMRFKSFKNRYWIFLKYKEAFRNESPVEDCKLILDKFLQAMDESRLPYVSTQWMLGKKYIFFSEGTRQHLEAMRQEFYHKHATAIQSAWRGYRCRKRWPALKQQQMYRQQRRVLQQISLIQSRTHGPEHKLQPELDGAELLRKAARMYNIDLNTVPCLPPSRAYTVKNNVKIEYPQIRVLREDYPRDPQDGCQFLSGQEVKVIGASPRRGFLVVQGNNSTHHVPYSLLDLKVIPVLTDEQKGMSVCKV